MEKAIRYILTAMVVWACTAPAHAQLKFTGAQKSVIEEKPEASTGLNMIYVLESTQGVKASFTAKSEGQLHWLKYGNLGGGHAEEIATSQQGKTYTIELGSDDAGYIIEDGTTRYYYWVVNYANHRADFQSLSFAEEQDCDRARLMLNGNAARINYFTINGASKVLSRALNIDYYTLKYDEEAMTYQQIDASQTFDYIDQTIGVFAPLCDTRFTLTGDKFLKAWGEEISVESDTYKAIAVEAQTKAEQEVRDVPNEQKLEANLGGSGPVNIHFEAAVTDAAIFHEWQMTKDPTFESIEDRYTELSLDITFRENGNTYVRFVANNAAGTCEYMSDTYEVFIGESDLLCPNAFSPNGDGVNDEWRVSYKSIVEFECHIYNKWGQEIISFNDPAMGWDGRYKGKLVPTGVYYYVIRARGAEGKKYKLEGDINILKSSVGSSQGGATEE